MRGKHLRWTAKTLVSIYDTTSEQYLCPGVDRRSFYKQGFYDGRVPFHGRSVQAQGAGLKKKNNRRCLNQLYTSLKQHFL